MFSTIFFEKDHLSQVEHSQVFLLPFWYLFSLFWAVQTLTSIGYGNVMPLTATEWWISTTAMLLAGILWAYVIGKFTNST
jgi:hypothetical protein